MVTEYIYLLNSKFYQVHFKVTPRGANPEDIIKCFVWSSKGNKVKQWSVKRCCIVPGI